jgi:hypothetical protein
MTLRFRLSACAHLYFACMLSFTTVHILQNVITIIKVCYYIYVQNLLFIFSTMILSMLNLLVNYNLQLYPIEILLIPHVQAIPLPQFVGIVTVYLYTKFHIPRHDKYYYSTLLSLIMHHVNRRKKNGQINIDYYRSVSKATAVTSATKESYM